MKHLLKIAFHDKVVEPIIQPFENAIEPIKDFLNAEDINVFEKLYDFTDIDVVVMRRGFEETLRTNPDDSSNIDMKGDVNEYSQWLVHIENNGRDARIQNVKTMNYLRITEVGSKVDCAGNGNAECLFHIYIQSLGVVKLESNDYPGKFLKIDETGIHVGDNDKWCRIMCFTRGQDTSFVKPYTFDKPSHILIEHIGMRYLAVKHSDSHELVHNGDPHSHVTQWHVEPLEDKQYITLKNHKTGKYIRIHERTLLPDDVVCDGDGKDAECIFKIYSLETTNQVRLENVKFNNKYIAVDGTKVRVGKGGHHCIFNLYEKR